MRTEVLKTSEDFSKLSIESLTLNNSRTNGKPAPGQPSKSFLKRQQRQRENRPSPDDPSIYTNTSQFRIAERIWKRVGNDVLAEIDNQIGAAAPGNEDTEAAAEPTSCVAELADFATPDLARRAGLNFLEIDFRSSLEAIAPSLPAAQVERLAAWFSADSRHAYSDSRHPGLIVIPCPLTPRAQREIVSTSCREWTLRPATNNLDLHWDFDEVEVPEEERGGFKKPVNLFDVYQSAFRNPGYPYTVPLKPPEEQGEAVDPYTGTANGINGRHLTPVPAIPLLHRLRWTSLGYAYEWSSKSYMLDQRHPMPELLDSMCRLIAKATENLTGYPYKAYNPEAGVINFYSPGSALHSHQDRSEPNTSAPLISLSLGKPCVFLMGGPTTDDKPSAYYLRSGCIVIMSGKGRRCFHGVPRIFQLGTGISEDDNLDPDEDREEWEPWRVFMREKRINVNVRQVFEGERFEGEDVGEELQTCPRSAVKNGQ